MFFFWFFVFLLLCNIYPIRIHLTIFPIFFFGRFLRVEKIVKFYVFLLRYNTNTSMLACNFLVAEKKAFVFLFQFLFILLETHIRSK